MGRYLSEDLRVRVIRAIDGGLSRRAAAARFGVGVSSAIRWMRAYLEEGRATAKVQGGDQRSGRIEAQHEFLMQAVQEAPDITLAELRERLIEERGETFAVSTIHQFFRRHGVSYKKRPRTPASRSART
jgi:transposase